MIEVVRIPALQDNYIWMLHDDASGETVIVDPAEAAPVLAEAERRGWTISHIWNTHWHGDHIGGNAAIKAATGAHISGPRAEADKIPTLDTLLAEGDSVTIGGETARVLEVPAHTAGHIAYYLPENGLLFVGDTMFAMGCGRLFEGTPAQMWRNMERFAALPDETQVYCAHEYTLGNARFAATVEPDNPAVTQRLAEVTAARERGEATVPTTIGQERATNPFLRAGSAEELGRRRALKDAA